MSNKPPGSGSSLQVGSAGSCPKIIWDTKEETMWETVGLSWSLEELVLPLCSSRWMNRVLPCLLCHTEPLSCTDYIRLTDVILLFSCILKHRLYEIPPSSGGYFSTSTYWTVFISISEANHCVYTSYLWFQICLHLFCLSEPNGLFSVSCHTNRHDSRQHCEQRHVL